MKPDRVIRIAVDGDCVVSNVNAACAKHLDRRMVAVTVTSDEFYGTPGSKLDALIEARITEEGCLTREQFLAGHIISVIHYSRLEPTRSLAFVWEGPK